MLSEARRGSVWPEIPDRDDLEDLSQTLKPGEALTPRGKKKRGLEGHSPGLGGAGGCPCAAGGVAGCRGLF